MLGVGIPELLIIVGIVALLFGAPVLTFFVGYVVGKSRAAAQDVAQSPVTPPDARQPEPSSTQSPAPTAEEPADE